ncbi:leucine-rich repeat domain-containing protein [Candidatus Poribacteria bacterium]|nr:leucine-rich repeat domain-containing protein [Candidatus Poribacteria bacterium]
MFPDPNLKAAIREALNKPEGPITDEDLAGLTQLDASERGIIDLTGIEYCINLQYLHLGWNLISDISPLSNLTNLQWLMLWINQISNISPLSSLTNLQGLWLQWN